MAKLTKSQRSAAAKKGWRTRRRSNPIKPVKYLGSTIQGTKGHFFAYALGRDIYGKTISEVKDKIHKLQFAGLPRRK